MGELVEYTSTEQRRFDEAAFSRARKERGHFGTPAAIADYMARMFSEVAEFPDHMIYFNGDKFMGPYPKRSD